MSTICVPTPTLTSVRVSGSPTVINTSSNVVITPEGFVSTITFTTCVPITDNPIIKRQQRCTPSVVTSPTFIPGVPVTRQVPVQVTITQFQTLSTTLFGTSCSVSPLPASPSPSPSSSSSTSFSSSSSSPSQSSSPSRVSSSQSASRATPVLTSSVYVVPVPIATSDSSTIYSYSTYVSYFSTDTADGSQPTDAGLSDSSSGQPVSRLKVVGGVFGGIFGAVLLGFVGYLLFKKMTGTHKHKSARAEDGEHLRDEDAHHVQSGHSGSEPYYDQSHGGHHHHLHGTHEHGVQGQGSHFTHDGGNGSQTQGGSYTPDTSAQGQGGSYTPDTSAQGQGGSYTPDTSAQGQGGSYTPDASAQGQGGSYGQSYGQDVGQYTQMHGQETQGMHGQGIDSNAYGQETGYVQQAGAEHYNSLGGHFTQGYDPFQAAQNAQGIGHPVGADLQHYAHSVGQFQGQNPFSDTSGAFQGQMSQAPFGAPPSIQAGSSAAVGGASLGLVTPVAAATYRGVAGRRNTTAKNEYASAGPLRSPNRQLRRNPI